MSITIIKTETQRKQVRILNTLKNLELLPKVTVEANSDRSGIWIKHKEEYVPDFKLVWSEAQQHYRVYILIAYTDHSKQNAGYTILSISNGYAAMGFGAVYSFIHKHRANNKDLALVS